MAQSSMEIRPLTGSVPRENQQVWPLPPIPFFGRVAELNGCLLPFKAIARQQKSTGA